MAKTKKVKISAAKRSQHLRAKKKSTKQKFAQAKADKAKKRESGNKPIETLSTKEHKEDKNLKRKRKQNDAKKKPQQVQHIDLNDEEIFDNIKDVLEDEDQVYDPSEEGSNKRAKKFENDGDIEDEESTMFENEYARNKLRADNDAKFEIDLLPIKDKDGQIIGRTTEVDYNEYRRKGSKEGDEQNEEENDEGYDEDDAEYEDSDDDIVNDEGASNQINIADKKFISTTDLLILREQEIEKQKYRIGIICSGILEKPEEKLKNFKALFNLLDEKNENGTANFFTVRKLACLSIAEVFKDILPEYRVGQVDPKMTTIRKATLERVTYENTLLQLFKKYLTKLEKITALMTKKSKTKVRNKEKMCEVAVICLCELLSSHPYFNYVQNVAQLLVYMLNCNVASIRSRVNQCFKNLFDTDKRYDMTLFVIRRINHLIKTRSNNVHTEMITCFLSLKIKNINLDAEKENELKVKKLENFRQRLWNMSKKERKRQRKLKDLNKELLETKAEENKQTKQYKLTEVTKMVFTIYFRLLKNDPNSKLMSACLEGLAEFAHVINLEFFSDLIEVLHGLLESEELGYREELHCIETIFAILSGQGEVLNIDPIRFYGHLYQNLLHVDAGYSHNDSRIVLRILNDVLTKRRKNISNHRLSAFVKRILTLSLQLMHNGTLGCLGVVKTLFQLTSTLDVILDTDCSFGSGNYDPYLEDPEYCNATCTALYETSLLIRHYHPIVKKFGLYIANGAPASSSDSLPPEIGKLTVEELYKNFDSSEMAFNPPIPVPKNTESKKEKHSFKIDSEFVEHCNEIANNVTIKEINFHQLLKN